MPKDAHPPGRARARPPGAVAAAAGRRRAAAAAHTAAAQAAASTVAAAAGTPARANRGRRAARAVPAVDGIAGSSGGAQATRGRRGARKTATASSRAAPGVASASTADNAAFLEQLRDLVRETVRDSMEAEKTGGGAAATSAPQASTAALQATTAAPQAPIAGPQIPAAAPQAMGAASQTWGVAVASASGVAPSEGSTSHLGHVGPSGMDISESSSQQNAAPKLSIGAGDFSFSVSPSLRQKIVEHKFINFALLLDAAAADPQAGSFMIVGGRIEAPPPPKEIHTYAAWCSAFLRYAGIYLAAHPEDALGLIKHMRQVDHLQSRGLGYAWREFDMQFRRARELDTATYQWGTVTCSAPMWLNALVSGSNSRAGPANNRAMYQTGQDKAGPSGGSQSACADFNFRKCFRQRCIFKHTCFECRGMHPAAQCPRARSRFLKQKTGSAKYSSQ